MAKKTLAELLKQAADPYNCVIEKQPRHHESWIDEDTLTIIGVGITHDRSAREISIRVYENIYGMNTQHWSGLNTLDRITFQEDTSEETILAQAKPFLQNYGFSLKTFFKKIRSQ